MKVQICRTDNHPCCIRTKGQFHVRHSREHNLLNHISYKEKSRLNSNLQNLFDTCLYVRVASKKMQNSIDAKSD